MTVVIMKLLFGDNPETSVLKHNLENMSVVSNGVVERTAIVMGAGDKLTMNASSDVSISVYA